jgi:hypothetical protein
MALTKLVFKPGINRDQTNYAAEGSYYECDKIRFRSGYPEKIGGWVVQTFSPYIGSARQLFSWATTDGSQLIAVGTNEKIYVVAGTNVIDITPIRATYDNSTTPSTNNCFSTTINSTTVLVTINTHGATEGAYVTFSGAVAVGGVTAPNLNKEFKISNVTTNTFTITVAAPATSTVASGGGTGITAAFQINIGFATTTAGYGWGTDAWGDNGWGAGSNNPIFFPARLLFFDNYNNDLIFNTAYTKITNSDDGYIYYWQYNTAFSNRAELLSDIAGAIAVPEKVQKITFSPSGHLLAIGGTEYDASNAPTYLGPYSPIVIRWANVDADIGPDPLIWQPTTANTAGFLYIRSGTDLITTINTRQETLVFTNVSLDSLQFLGTTEVFSVQPLSNNITIMGPNAVVETNNIVYWMGTDKFYTYSGRVDTLPCTLRQYIFQDINFNLKSTFFAGTNNQFNEIIWFYASGTANNIDRYVIYNYAENIWYYGQLHRTAWIDEGVIEVPIAAADGWVYNHEVGSDDGQPLGAQSLPIESYIQSADVDIDDGDKFMLIRRIIPDVNFRGSTPAANDMPLTPTVQLTVGVRNFPGAANATSNASNVNNERNVTSTAVIDQYTNQVFVRCRGRQMNFKIASDGLGVSWQLGLPRIDARPDGTRG